MVDQKRINQNLVNTTSILNKALLNVLQRQLFIFEYMSDPKMIDLISLDMELLKQLQIELDKMKGLV